MTPDYQVFFLTESFCATERILLNLYRLFSSYCITFSPLILTIKAINEHQIKPFLKTDLEKIRVELC